jgi:hypothetical protein
LKSFIFNRDGSISGDVVRKAGIGARFTMAKPVTSTAESLYRRGSGAQRVEVLHRKVDRVFSVYVIVIP